jgi:hydroxyacylglutathione hydrolase
MLVIPKTHGIHSKALNDGLSFLLTLYYKNICYLYSNAERKTLYIREAIMRITPSIYLVGDSAMGITKGGDCHVYLIKGSSGIFLIDAGNGYDSPGLIGSIESEGFNPADISHILLTHHHTDHARGAKALRDRYGCQVLISGNMGKYFLEEGNDEELWVNDAKKCGLYPQDYSYIHCPVDHAVQDLEEFVIAGVNVTAFNVPGHSPDSVCYLVNLDGYHCLFNGDSFYYGGILGVLNYPGSDLREYHRSLPRLMDLSVEGLFPGHGLFCLTGGQEIIKATWTHLKEGVFVPFSVGQIPISVV